MVKRPTMSWPSSTSKLYFANSPLEKPNHSHQLVNFSQYVARTPFWGGGWRLAADECAYTRLGMGTSSSSIYGDMQQLWSSFSSCALKTHATEASSDPPCPLRVPGCRCLTGVGPSSTGDPFMGAYVQGTADERLPVDVIKDYVRSRRILWSKKRSSGNLRMMIVFSMIAEIRYYEKKIKAKRFRRTKASCSPPPSLKLVVSTTVISSVTLWHLTSKGP